MKWMLVIVVFGTMPVKTNLLFNTLDECLTAENSIRSEYARVFNTWLEWATQNPTESGYPDSQAFIMKRNGLQNSGTCVPHSTTELN